MALTINTNVASLNAQRNLSSSSMDLSTSLQRLSSGLRINSAKDDAAGLAISERMTTQIRGMNVAMRNANDGVSLAQTAEGSLDSVSSSLQRIRELAVQSANATNSASDRAALDAEAQQLKSEINRVATQTNFNGVKLLDGSFTNKTFQVGANTGETISVSSIVNAKSTDLGVTSIATAAQSAASAFGTTIADGNITIQNDAGVAVNVAGFVTGSDAAGVASSVLEAINKISDQTGVYATITDGTTDQITLTSDDNITVTIDGTTATAATTGLTTLTATAANVTGFDALDISSVGGANTAISYMDSALDAVNTARADLGAIQTRFESVVSNLAINSENTSAARGRIRDADFAAETASLSRNQILQQAGTAMLAQANQLPQNVLSLLR